MQSGPGWRHAVLGAAAVGMLGSGFGFAPAQRAAAATAAQTTPADQPAKSEALFKRLCGDCHELNTVTASRRERQQWVDVIDEMFQEGLKATDEEYNVVVDYLLRHYGRVNVNRAPAADLVAVLGIAEADAGRIVAHRQAHGSFESFEALAKVPGIDVEKLRAARLAIGF